MQSKIFYFKKNDLATKFLAKPLSTKIKIIYEHPKILLWLIVGELVAIVSMSKFNHCSISDGQYVLDSSFFSSEIIPINEFMSRDISVLKTTIIDEVEVDVSMRLNRPRSGLLYVFIVLLLRFLSFGLIAIGNSCVDDVKTVLANSKINVPNTIYSPDQLAKYMNTIGYKSK